MFKQSLSHMIFWDVSNILNRLCKSAAGKISSSVFPSVSEIGLVVLAACLDAINGAVINLSDRLPFFYGE